MQCIATHVPLPSQTTPPLSLQAMPFGAFMTPQVFPVHVGVAQTVLVAGQSLAMRQATHAPLPSHTVPLLVEHAWPGAMLVVPQHPISHALATQSLAGVGQSGIAVQDIALPGQPPPVPVAVVEVVEEVVVEVLPSPPAPPMPGTLVRSTDAMTSQPVADAASAPAARRKAVKA
jgi:hypothetical protein